jgi:S-(hydroxymethyl)glutathione dehydrogenase/alcohol dehydrogenase
MTVRAALLAEIGAPLRLVDLTLPQPGPGQVRVRVAATGVCHSDFSLARGTLRQPVPAVLGHETAGTVASVGEGVTSVAVGDRVVLVWAAPCRNCWYCSIDEPWLCERSSDAANSPYAQVDGVDVFPGLSTGGFATETVVHERAVLPVPDGVPLEQAALVGCAVMTGIGAVLDTARVQPGQTVLVVGLGGVGLSVVQGARLARASRVIAVDRSPDKLALAQTMGATDVLEAGGELAKQVRALTGGRGADHAFDCVGHADTIRSCWSATRRGGTTVVVGIGGKEQQVTFTALELFHFARTLKGCVYGGADPSVLMPRILAHAAAGEVDLGALISGTIGLGDIDAAFADMANGVGARAVVVPT